MTNELTPTELRATACELADLGVRTARLYFGRASASRKADDTPVTDADHNAQAAILDSLARRHPDHAVITEETIARPRQHAAVSAADYCWVIDPIDGTRNFARSVDLWCTSVAVLRGGRPIAGAICDSTGESYSAAAGQGACRHAGSAIHLAPRPIGADTTIAISSPRRAGMLPAVHAWMERYLYRNLGSLCLHLVWVAAGLVDAAYASECKLWDIAAGSLLIEEAGGIATDHQGNPIWPVNVASHTGADLPILVGSPMMHARLLNDLREAQ
jgi:myo-inositol-1(or 4)-monophosphatase